MIKKKIIYIKYVVRISMQNVQKRKNINVTAIMSQLQLSATTAANKCKLILLMEINITNTYVLIIINN